jgi:SAM-dependent methyltransferase
MLNSIYRGLKNISKLLFAWDAEFIRPKLKLQNYISYIHRYYIYAFINKQRANFSGSVLDLGCGASPYLECFDSFKCDYTGIDIHKGEKEGEVNYHQYDGSIIPFEVESFKIIVATEVFEHVGNLNLFKEVYRVLQKDGTFYLTIPFIHHLHEQPHDYWRYTKFGIENVLKDYGFTITYLEPRGGIVEVFLSIVYYLISQIPFLGPARLFIYLFILPITIISRVFTFDWNIRSSANITLGYQIICKKI